MRESIIGDFRKANSPETSPEELKRLALSDDDVIRAAVVHNQSRPVSCIEILFNDKSDIVKEALAMNNYPVYPQITKANKVIGKTLVLRNANQSDAEFIVKLRTNEKKGRFISSTSSDIDKQREWLRSYGDSDDQAYFIIEDMNSNKYGTVRMYNSIKHSFCWGSWVISEDAPTNFAIESALVVYNYAKTLGFFDSHFEVMKGNCSVIKFHERFGAERIGENEIEYQYKITKDNIERSLKRYSKYLPEGIKIHP
ncbi:TPA: GNAT family N-acetyltransferase [Escherichia coli]|nr:GNAT family N-acetyltransferase [Escherichia coli]